jgi:hypothetical protein
MGERTEVRGCSDDHNGRIARHPYVLGVLERRGSNDTILTLE